jgi:hypothetical protein
LLARLEKAAEACSVVVINQQVPSSWTAEAVPLLNALITRHPQTLFIVDSRDYPGDFPATALKLNIREAAMRKGTLAEHQLADLTPAELIHLIFLPGFSTAEQPGEDAGRGIGLDAVKDMIARQGGRIRIGTTRGEYCHFRVQLPLAKIATAGPGPGPEPVARESVGEVA